MVARYCLGGLTARWIRSHVLQITAVLSAYGFVVISNGFDGASENRSAMRQLLTKTLIEVKPSLFDGVEHADTKPKFRLIDENEIDEPPLIETRQDGSSSYEVYYHLPKQYRSWELPFDLKVAYPHPILGHILIFPTADWPHGVKKVTNAGDASSTEKKSQRDLHLNHKPIRLEMAYEAWKNSAEG